MPQGKFQTNLAQNILAQGGSQFVQIKDHNYYSKYTNNIQISFFFILTKLDSMHSWVKEMLLHANEEPYFQKGFMNL